MKRIREGLTLVLIAALPFHAIFVTIFTKLIAGPGHSPLPALALWKEGILGLVVLVAFIEVLQKWKMKNGQWKIDSLDLCILGFILLSLLQSFILNSPFSILHYAFGFKYDFLPLVAFLILRRVSWSSSFIRTAVAALPAIGTIVVVYGIAAMLLPQGWFTWLGYNDLHSLYVPGSPLAPFQQIESIGIRRMQSTFSGPNQMGLWMLIPLSLSIIEFMQTKTFVRLFVCSLFVIGILLSFSRAAWIAAAAIFAVVLWKYVPKEKRIVAGCWLLVAGLVIAVAGIVFAPNVLLRSASSRDHWQRPLRALQIMKEHPMGLGLGTAGPASNRFSDTCVDLPAGANASWVQAHPELCVFVGGEQVRPPLPSGELWPASQPADRTCSCPLLPENWYLQIGVELGWLGFALFGGLVILVLLRLSTLKMENGKWKIEYCIFLSFLGISTVALFLHAWEDSAVAYTIWLFIASLVPVSGAQGPPLQSQGRE